MRRRDKIPVLILTTTAGAVVGASAITLMAIGISLTAVFPFVDLARKVRRKVSKSTEGAR